MVRLTESSEYNEGKLTNSTKLDLSAGFDAETSAALAEVEHTFGSKLEFLVGLESCVYAALANFCTERLSNNPETQTKDSKAINNSVALHNKNVEEFYDEDDEEELREHMMRTEKFFDDEEEFRNRLK